MRNPLARLLSERARGRSWADEWTFSQRRTSSPKRCAPCSASHAAGSCALVMELHCSSALGVHVRVAQLQRITSKKVNAYKCHECGYLSEKLLPQCRDKGHRTTTMQLTKRWFSCGRCREHTSVLNKRLPDSCCKKCGSTEWKESGMKRSADAPLPASEFLPRGEELGKFRGSAPSTSFVQGAGSSSQAGPVRPVVHDPNAWQGTLPTHTGE